MSLATRLKTSRKKHGLSQTELARKVEVSQPTIANWERGGHIPRPDALQRIADALGTDPAWLVSGEMPARSNPAHQHLAKPIHHISVHEWPHDHADPSQAQPVRYMAVAADTTHLFALESIPSTNFPDGSILVFSKTNKNMPGRYLMRTREGFELSETNLLTEDVFARLVYSVVPH